MKSNFFSTRKVSVLVIILVFTFGGACTPQESHVTYFDNKIVENSKEEANEEIIIEDLGDNTKKIKTKKEKIELEEKEMPKIEETTEIVEENSENNEIVEEKDDSSSQSSKVETNTQKATEQEDEQVVATEEKEEESETEEETAVESVLEENIIESAKENVTMADRAEATALAMKRLSAGELRSLIAMSRGGFTADEKKKALQMMHEKFSKEEQEWILSKFYEYVGSDE